MSTGRVLAAYLHPNTVSHSFMHSMVGVVEHDHTLPSQLIAGMLDVRCGAGALVASRNSAVAGFLDDCDAEWLWLVDTDMGFAPDTVARLVGAADPALRPVVGALCFGLIETGTDGMGGWVTETFATLYDWRADDQGREGFAARQVWQRDALVRVDGTGAACLLVHRDAVAKVRAEHGDHWFTPVQYPDGTQVGEDLSFCWRLGQIGIPLHVHTGVRTTHHKQVWIG